MHAVFIWRHFNTGWPQVVVRYLRHFSGKHFVQDAGELAPSHADAKHDLGEEEIRGNGAPGFDPPEHIPRNPGAQGHDILFEPPRLAHLAERLWQDALAVLRVNRRQLPVRKTSGRERQV